MIPAPTVQATVGRSDNERELHLFTVGTSGKELNEKSDINCNWDYEQQGSGAEELHQQL